MDREVHAILASALDVIPTPKDTRRHYAPELRSTVLRRLDADVVVPCVLPDHGCEGVDNASIG